MELSPLFCGRLVGTRTRDLYRVKVVRGYHLGVVSLKTKDLASESLRSNCARNAFADLNCVRFADVKQRRWQGSTREGD